MSPKRLLRLREAQSNISEFSEERFKLILPDENPNLVEPSKVEKLIFCSGQLYYDLAKARSDLKKNQIAIVRVEQVAPFPVANIQEQCEKYSNARIIWAQEEHYNMGAWSFVSPKMNNLLAPAKKTIKYIGRASSAAPATGFQKTHNEELAAILEQAMQ